MQEIEENVLRLTTLESIFATMYRSLALPLTITSSAGKFLYGLKLRSRMDVLTVGVLAHNNMCIAFT